MPLASWCEGLQANLSANLTSSSSSTPDTNVTFLCDQGDQLRWHGLAYLATLSRLFVPLSGEEQKLTVLMPGYDGHVLRKLLLLLTSGEVVTTQGEMEDLQVVANDLGVRETKLFHGMIFIKCRTKIKNVCVFWPTSWEGDNVSLIRKWALVGNPGTY